jgi:hypothetical protein
MRETGIRYCGTHTRRFSAHLQKILISIAVDRIKKYVSLCENKILVPVHGRGAMTFGQTVAKSE